MAPKLPLLAPLALVLLPMVLAACGGGGGSGAGIAPTSSATDSLAARTTLTLAEYQARRQPVATASAEDVRHARELAIQLTVPQQIQGSGFVLGASQEIAWLQLLNAAASGDTATELSTNTPAGALDGAGAVLTLPLQRELMIHPSGRLSPNFWQATEEQANQATVTSWQASEVNLGTSNAMPYLLFSTAYQARLAIRDRLSASLSWSSAVTTKALFTDEAGLSHFVDALRISAPLATMTTADFQAEAATVDGWTVLKLTPVSGRLVDFGSARLAAAIKTSTDTIWNSAATSGVGDLVLPPLHIGDSSTYTNAALSGVTLAFNPTKANLSALDGVGGLFATAVATSLELSVDVHGLKLNGDAWMGFAFNPTNEHAYDGLGSILTNSASYPSVGCFNLSTYDSFTPCVPPPCPANAPRLQSFFLALLDAHGVLQALTWWVPVVPKAADCG